MISKKDFKAIVSFAALGSKPLISYKITRDTWADAFKLRQNLCEKLKERGFIWYKDFLISIRNNNMEISIFTKEVDEALRIVAPEFIL